MHCRVLKIPVNLLSVQMSGDLGAVHLHSCFSQHGIRGSSFQIEKVASEGIGVVHAINSTAEQIDSGWGLHKCSSSIERLARSSRTLGPRKAPWLFPRHVTALNDKTSPQFVPQKYCISLYYGTSSSPPIICIYMKFFRLRMLSDLARGWSRIKDGRGLSCGLETTLPGRLLIHSPSIGALTTGHEQRPNPPQQDGQRGYGARDKHWL